MRLGLKLLLIGVTMLLLLIPLLLLSGLVNERQQRANEVKFEVAESSSRAQMVVGPLLLVEFERDVTEQRMVLESGVQREISETKTVRDYRLRLPESIQLSGELKHEQRGRALFSALLYHVGFAAQARFETKGLLGEGERLKRVDLLIGLGDNRGIKRISLSSNGSALALEPGARLQWLQQGVQASLSPAALEAAELAVALDLELSGTESLDFVPVGAETRVQLSGDWPHPSFRGNLLPSAPKLSETGFDASWTVSRLASQAQQVVQRCSADANHCALHSVSFGLRLVDPVDRYLMTERAMKYALLVLVLVFGAVFFVEVVGRGELHPLHYGLIGLALAMFYLLLLALAEHIGFGFAFSAAAAASSGLIAVYLAGVLESRRSGYASGGLLLALYAVLYGLLKAEDYALLLGAVTLFGCLAVFMLATRRVRWAPITPPRPG